MQTRREFLNELVKENDLVIEEDLFEMKFKNGRSVWIIRREGIEKIQYNNNIQVKFEDIVTECDFAVVKATASKDNWNGSIESYGSAWLGNNSTNNYMAEMAEKRSLARVVLKISGAYKHGFYGEDESDDFKQKKDFGSVSG